MQSRALVLVAALGLPLAACEPGLQPQATATVTLTGATFAMGSALDCTDSTGPACKGDRAPHLVRVSSFNMQTTEVTRIHYATCVLAGACREQGAFDPRQKDRPQLVSDPEDARAYCRWINMRLPTEAEFEFAARADRLGKLHNYPWGRDEASDKPPTCDKVSFAGCPAPSSYDVGTAPKDVTDTGIHDLAGGVPEWVEDNYDPYMGCASRLGYSDLCWGQGASCPESRCTADDKQCARGCLPQPDDLSSSGRGPNVGSAAVCPLQPELQSPPIDPVVRSSTGRAVVRGGGPTDGACAFAGFTRRNAIPNRFRAGFRCAESADTSARLTPLTSYRFVITGCQPDGPRVKMTIGTDENPNAVYALEVIPPGGGGMTYMSQSGVVEDLPCDAVFIMRPGSLKNHNLDVRATSPRGCRKGTRSVNLTGGGDVPGIGLDQLQLTADCM